MFAGLDKAIEDAPGGGHGLHGHSHRGFPLEEKVFKRLASDPRVKTICETGFNGGHSALRWLLTNPTARIISFDIGDGPGEHHVEAAAAYLKEHFGDRFELVLGNSAETLPAYHAKHPEFRCDLSAVDGGHTYALAKHDLKNLREMTASDGTVAVDDADVQKDKGIDGVLAAVKKLEKWHEFDATESYSEGHRALTVGHFVVENGQSTAWSHEPMVGPDGEEK